jgi:hypothetical protein
LSMNISLYLETMEGPPTESRKVSTSACIGAVWSYYYLRAFMRLFAAFPWGAFYEVTEPPTTLLLFF